MHPRTCKRMDEYQFWPKLPKQIEVKETVSYRAMLQKICEAEYVLTDSGGLQEEACILGVPCYTLRKTTERPETVTCGANVVLGIEEPANIFQNVYSDNILCNWYSPYGNGTAAKQIIEYSTEYLSK